MRLQAFRIQNFRSIVDTGWCTLSSDNITAVIGQNEAGKSAVIEAILAFFTHKVSRHDLRSDGSQPSISISFGLSKHDVKELTAEWLLPSGVSEFLAEKERLNITRVWSGDSSSVSIEEEELSTMFPVDEQEQEEEEEGDLGEEQDENIGEGEPDEAPESSNRGHASTEESPIEQSQDEGEERVTTESEFLDWVIEEALPSVEFFEDFGSLLPDSIDLADLTNPNSTVRGYKGAKNLLAIAGLEPNELSTGDLRQIENKINRLNMRISADFREFWSQTVGRGQKISIEFSLKNHGSDQTDKAGKPYIAFWICDEHEKLYPKQRSKGVRWFTSFYLQLKASSLNKDAPILFLIDEPGGSLHQKAQGDVLKVLEEIRERVQVIYTTHSPHLMNLDTIYRILAIQRSDTDDSKSDTIVLNPHQLGAASTDTLTPLYTLMGVDVSHQNVIEKENNILLEEISAFYYLKAFLALAQSDMTCQFLPATGANNIPQLANLLLGWGIGFAVVLDDDTTGRKVYKILLDTIYGSKEEHAKEKVLKISNCSGIEDIFTQEDFKKLVMEDESFDIAAKNSDALNRTSKAMLARKFFMKVSDGEIGLADLSDESASKINDLLTKISALKKDA